MSKITISLHDNIVNGLHEKIGRGRISQFIEQLIKPYFIDSALEAAYREMKKDADREAEAEMWSESLIGDINDEAR